MEYREFKYSESKLRFSIKPGFRQANSGIIEIGPDQSSLCDIQN